MHGYTKTQPFAWSGWRLTIPGGPEGGQYHGFVAQDGADLLSRVPPAPGLPAPYAQPAPWDDVWGGTALQEGQNPSDYVFRGPAEIRPRANASGGAHTVLSLQTRRTAGYAVAPGNYKGLGIVANPEFCPAWGCSGSAPRAGATATVPQPPPPGAGPIYTTRGSTPPISPAPAPTVSATPTQSSSIVDWFSSTTIIPGVENAWIAAGVVAAFLFFRGRK